MDVIDVPSILGLADRIPPDIRKALEPWEIGARAAYARGLLAGAESQPPEAAASARVLASRVLAALPVRDYLTRLAYLDTTLQAATASEDFDEAGRIFGGILRLQAHSPQVPADILSSLVPEIAAEMDFGNRAASRAAGLPKATGR